MAQDLKLKHVIISYPHLVEPRAVTKGGDPKFSANFILPRDYSYDLLKELVGKCVQEKWGATPPQGLRMPWKEVSDGPHKGQWQLSSYADRRPDVYGPKVSEGPLDEVDIKTLVFAGALVNAHVRLYAYDVAGNRGVGVGLNGVQLISTKMPRLDGGKSSAEVFEDEDGEVERVPVQTWERPSESAPPWESGPGAPGDDLI